MENKIEFRTKTDDSEWSEWRDPTISSGIGRSAIPTILDYPNSVSVILCKDIGLGNRLWTEYRYKKEVF